MNLLRLITAFGAIVCAGCAHVVPSASDHAPKPAVATTPAEVIPVADGPVTSEAPVTVEVGAEIAATESNPAQKFSGIAEKKNSTAASAGIRVTGGFKRFNDDQPEYFDPNDPYFVPEDGGTKSDAEIYLYDKFRDRPDDPAPVAPAKK